jgi:hypothetical protein
MYVIYLSLYFYIIMLFLLFLCLYYVVGCFYTNKVIIVLDFVVTFGFTCFRQCYPLLSPGWNDAAAELDALLAETFASQSQEMVVEGEALLGEGPSVNRSEADGVVEVALDEVLCSVISVGETGIDQIDNVLALEVLGVIGKLTLARGRATSTKSVATSGWDSLEACIEPLPIDDKARFVQNFLVVYEGATDPVAVHSALAKHHPENDVGICAGVVAGQGVVALVRKGNTKRLVGCVIDGAAPTMYKFSQSRGRGGGALESSIRKVSSTMNLCVSSLIIREPRAGAYSFEQLCDGMRRLTPIQREVLKGLAVVFL